MTGSNEPLGSALSRAVPWGAARGAGLLRPGDAWFSPPFFLGLEKLRRGCFPRIGRNARTTAYFVVLQLIFFQLLWELEISEMP